MELRQYLITIWRWKWLILATVLIAVLGSYIASRAATPLYRTTTTLMVGQATQNPDPNSSDLRTGQDLAHTYVELARHYPILQGALGSLGLKMNLTDLADRVTASVIPNTQLMEISVVDSNPQRAKALADAITKQLILLSPSTTGASDQAQKNFINGQLVELQREIQDAQQQVNTLTQQRNVSSSRDLIDLYEKQINGLEANISNWQNTYSRLLASIQGSNVNSLSVIEEATIPTKPFSPNILINVLLAAFIGLGLGVSAAFLIDYLDDTIKDKEEASAVSQLPVLGLIPRIDGSDYPEKLVAEHQPLSPTVETFRTLRTNMQYASIDRPLRTVVITSPSPSDGKSLTIANLAVVLAQSDRKVILVDTDLRRPIQHMIFGLANLQGLVDALLNIDPVSSEGPEKSNGEEVKQSRSRIQTYLLETQVKNLRLLPSGPLPPNPAELLGSERMNSLIEALREEADIVLFDSPPILAVTDAVILGTRVDGVVLVFNAGRTRASDAHRAVEELHHVRANVFGVVLNNRSHKGNNYNNYYYHYSNNGGHERNLN